MLMMCAVVSSSSQLLSKGMEFGFKNLETIIEIEKRL